MKTANFIFDTGQVSLDTGAVLNHMPCPMAIKTADSIYVGVNQVMASLGGFADQSQLIGKRDFELNCPAAEMHDIFVSQDQQALAEEQPLKSIDFCVYSDHQVHVCFTTKKKIIDRKNRQLVLFAIMNFSLDQIRSKFQKVNMDFSEFDFAREKVSFNLCKTFPRTTLSVRESECFYFLLRGYSAAQTASALGLTSKRTVEEYIDRVKLKLHCNTKQALFAYGFENGLTSYIPESLV